MSGSGLDRRLVDSVLDLLKKQKQELYTLDELYNHIESTVELTSEQLELHIQRAGQIEPNWKHDLRNLLQKEKTKSKLINPIPRNWGLPRKYAGPEIDHEFRYISLLKQAKALSNRGQFDCEVNSVTVSIGELEPGGSFKVLSDDGEKSYTISDRLVEARVKHLMNCGGAVVSGCFHKWKVLEAVITKLHPCLNYDQNNNIIYLSGTPKLDTVVGTKDDDIRITEWLVDQMLSRIN